MSTYDQENQRAIDCQAPDSILLLTTAKFKATIILHKSKLLSNVSGMCDHHNHRKSSGSHDSIFKLNAFGQKI